MNTAAKLVAAGQVPVFHAVANPGEDIAATLKAATQANMQALVVFGANGCGDCKMLDVECTRAVCKSWRTGAWW